MAIIIPSPSLFLQPGRVGRRAAVTPSALGTMYCDIDPGVSGSTYQTDATTTPQTTNEGVVGRIADASGNGRYAGGGSSATDRPNLLTSAIGGFNGVVFDGVYDRLIVNGSSTFQPHVSASGYHIELIWRPDYFRYMTPIGQVQTSTDKGLYTGLKENRTLQIVPCKGSSSNTVDFTPTYTYTLGAWVRTSIWYDPTVGTNGTTYHAVNGANQESKANTSAAGTGDATRALLIGAGNSGGGAAAFQDMGFARLIIYSACLTSGNRSALNSYMAARYGL